MDRLTISISPHLVTQPDTRSMMKGVINALIPALIMVLVFFRLQGLTLILTSVAGCCVTEFILAKTRGKGKRAWDNSVLVTGILLAMVLPPSLPLWMAFLGGIFAITLGKEVFGGIGHNIFNPALLARAFLVATFPVALTTWTRPLTLDAVTGATPLGLAKYEKIFTSIPSLLAGNVPGSLGETSAIAILIGLGYMVYKKIIDHRIPTGYIGTVIAVAGITHFIFPGKFPSPVFHVFAGGLLLGAVFMATDPVTSPVTAKGRWVFGIGCGLVTMTIRLWGGLPEGVMYSILLMNAVTPIINRVTRPKRFGANNAGK